MTQDTTPKTDTMDCPPKNIWPIGKKAALYSCAVVCLLGAFDTLDRQILAAVFPFIKEDWGLSDTQLGMLVTVVSVAVSVLVIPSAYIIDRWSRKKMISLMGGIWSVALLGCAVAGNFWHMLIARFFVGAGQAGYNPAAHALIGAQFPEQHRSLAVAVYHFFIALGAPAGLVVGAFIATHWGWRHALGIVALPTIILAIMALFIRDYKSVAVTQKMTDQTSGHVERKLSYGALVMNLLRTPSLLCVFVAAITMQMYTGAIMSWLPSYMIREGGHSVTYASTLASIIMMSSICSTLLVGPVLDRARRRMANGIPVVMAVCLTINAIGVFLAYAMLTPGSGIQLVVLIITGFFGGVFLTGGPVLLIDLTHPGARATVFSLLIFCQNIFGFACGPLITGYLSDTFGLGTALALQALITMTAALAYVVCIFTFKRDVAKVECVQLQFENA